MISNIQNQQNTAQQPLNAQQQQPQLGITLLQQQNPSSAQQQNQVQQVADKNQNDKNVKKEKPPGYIEQLWRALIRPPNRINYKPQQLGPTSFVVDKTVIVKREDFKVKNSRGFNLECSYFEPLQLSGKPHPCVLYLHGNSSSRNEGLVLIQYLLPFGISLVLMDFSGCGISEGEYISLGYYEKYDAKQVMEHVKNWKPITEFGLWGRSMGAATTLMTSLQEDFSLRYIVIDSSFISIRQLCEEIGCTTYKIPKCIINWAYSYIRGKIRGRANFDLDECNALKAVQNPKSKPSALFLVAQGDTLINPSHSQKLYNLYRGSKKLLMFEGTHNSRRPREINLEITKFFFNGLFDEHAMKHLKPFKMIPNLPNFNKADPIPQTQQKHGSISGPPPSEIHAAPNNRSSQLINNDKKGPNMQFTMANIQNKTRYEPTGQLKSKDVEQDDIQEEDEEDNTNTVHQNNNKDQKNNTKNDIQQKALPQNGSQQKPVTSKDNPNHGDIQFATQNIQNHLSQANNLNSNTQINTHQGNTAQNTYHNENNIHQGNGKNITTSNKNVDYNIRSHNQVMNFTQNKSNNHYQHADGDDFMRVDDSQKDPHEQDRMHSEESKVYSMNIANLPSQNFQGIMNTEGQDGSPKQPKSQYNFDSNNILINFQRYANNPNNNNNNINGGIMNNGNSQKQDIKEEEDTQFNSKIDKFDQENVNQNIGLSGFFIPQDHGSQVQQNSAQLAISIQNRGSGISTAHQNQNQNPILTQANSQFIIPSNVPLDTITLPSPEKSPSPFQFNEGRSQPTQTNQNPFQTSQSINANPQQQQQPSIFSLQRVSQEK